MNIFPEGSLATSLITTVWIGLFVICFFNIRLGWAISGLIVPGYLAPLIILKPWSAIAVIIEAIVTYLIVLAFSKIGSRFNFYCDLFGRDRFFFILLVSVLVRLLFDETFFPAFTLYLNRTFEIEFLYRDGLYSIGLVIVALTANQFWNTGLRRGIFQLFIVLMITFLIIKYVLIEFTNFRLAEIASVYENIATSILASPKAYIILITTAFIASRFNLLYGWEFSGIAIPALLALLWYKPMELGISILEAVIVFLIAGALLRTRLFSRMNIEGARKILFFFNIAFFYKYALGFILPSLFPGINVTDYFGFGYMLTSLIAIKMYDKEAGARIIGSTLITSFISIIIATLIGFILYLPGRLTNPDAASLSSEIVLLPDKYLSYSPALKSEKPPAFSRFFSMKINRDIVPEKLTAQKSKQIEEHILIPLCRILNTKSGISASESEMRKIAGWADYSGLKVTFFGNKAFAPVYIELRADKGENLTGTFYFRPFESVKCIVESDCKSKNAMELFRLFEEKFKPEILMADANIYRTERGGLQVNVALKYVKASLSSLVRSAIVREINFRNDEFNLIEIKTALSRDFAEPKRVYISTLNGAYSFETLNPFQKKVFSFLVEKGFKPDFVDGRPETVNLEALNTSSVKFAESYKNCDLMLLWLNR